MNEILELSTAAYYINFGEFQNRKIIFKVINLVLENNFIFLEKKIYIEHLNKNDNYHSMIVCFQNIEYIYIFFIF